MTIRTLLIAHAVLLVAGCAATEFEPLDSLTDKLALIKKEPKVQESEYATPAQMVAIWSDAVYTQPGQPPIRGFGGRLYFYNENSEPVPVQGQLVVYSYDDSAKGSPARAPDRKFVFTPEQLTQFYSPSELGASYSIWLPMDELGGVRKAITLLPVFTSTSGHVVMGHQTINILPGKVPEDAETQARGYLTPLGSTGRPGVRPASCEQPQQDVASTRDQWQQTHTFVPTNTARRHLRSTTIPLPMWMSRRLAVAPVTSGNVAGVQQNDSKKQGDDTRRPPAANEPTWDDSPARQSWGRPEAASTKKPGFAEKAGFPGGFPANAESSTTPGGTSTAPPSPRPPAARFERPRYQAPGVRRGRSNRGRAPMPPRPAGPPRAHPFPPSSGRSSATGGS